MGVFQGHVLVRFPGPLAIPMLVMGLACCRMLGA